MALELLDEPGLIPLTPAEALNAGSYLGSLRSESVFAMLARMAQFSYRWAKW